MEEQQGRRNVGEIEPVGGQPSRNSGQLASSLRSIRLTLLKSVIGIGLSLSERQKKALNGEGYQRTEKYDDEKLARMMLLDGCFVLQFIRWKGWSTNGKEYKKFHHLLRNARRVVIRNTAVRGERRALSSTRPLQSALLGQSQPEQEQQPEKKGKSLSSSQGGKWGFCCRWKKSIQRGIWQSFRHIKELKAAGIYLKPSRTCFLRDISFKSYFFFGYLKLPPITIDDFTKTKFLNMVAYEMCPDAPDDYAVTSYICFLYDLIDHADDVKELRSKHILHNLLGSDDDVAKIFNEISNDLVDPEAYKDVKDCIQKHYDKRVNTWTAQALHNHFRSPWTVMAFIAAVLILFQVSMD
ncbi:hypothetical protein CK203_061548 [Vitis vinifera]|uniref:Uncharacterized protein n=1 Tax=Vitis vinifera TaxID=29760 RepID=A0A438FQT7_VITVI|nr:hypothetical protein CK203_061548 [Vitis vinifera]